MSQNVSTGRGGAGNIGKDPPTSKDTLETPTIKSDKYSTGRGGTGNMAKNDKEHPEIARASQDVAPVPKKERSGSFHFGRGGAANVASADEETEISTGTGAGAEGEKKRTRTGSSEKVDRKSILQMLGVTK